MIFGKYVPGCVSSLFLSSIGIWLIVRVIKKDTQFFNDLLKVPLWLRVAGGVLLQGPLIIYSYIKYLGIRSGLFP